MAYRKSYRKKSTQKKRGFYASANLGAFGKYSVGYSKRSLASKVKTIMRAEEAPQHQLIPDGTLNTGLLHNTIYTWNPLSNLTWGAEGSGTAGEVFREGEVIRLEAIKFNHIFFTNTAISNQVSYRVMWIKSKLEFAPSPTYGSGFGITDLFMYQTGSTNVINAIPDKRRITVLKDHVYTCIPKIAGQVQTCVKEMTIPIHADFEYKPSLGYGKISNYYLIVIPFVPGGTGGVTSCGALYTNQDLIFKNSR